MARPHALLRVGFSFDRTLGWRGVFSAAVDLAIGSEGDLNILSRSIGRGRVRRWTLEDEDLGQFILVNQVEGEPSLTRTDEAFLRPVSIIADSEDNLWVSDEATHKISSLTKEGELLSQWGEHGTGDGQLYGPSGIAFDAEENIYVADSLNHRVQKLTKDGEFLMGWGSQGEGDGEFNLPWGIEVDELGDVYVVDWRNDRVQKFTAEGEFIFNFGASGSRHGEFNRPSGVAVDKDGDIYVADWGNHRVQLFDSEGRFVEKFIGDATLSKTARDYMMTNPMNMRLREMTEVEAQKRLRWPASVRVDDHGRMYVPDYASDRIQVYQKEAYPLEPDQIGDPLRSPTLFTQF